MPKVKVVDPAHAYYLDSVPLRNGWHNLYGSEADALNGSISRVFLTNIPISVPSPAVTQDSSYCCGGAALSIALGRTTDREAHNWLESNGYMTSAWGTSYSGINAYLNTQGYMCSFDGNAYDGHMSGSFYDAIINHLRKGYKVILCMHGVARGGRTDFYTRNGHYIVLCGIDDGKEPGKKKESTGFMFEVKQISAGSTGVDVLLLQEILKARGLYNGELDRAFGEQTRKALVAYQKSRKLTADGICGPKTWSDLLGKA